MIATALTIAGSDPSGGAGIQADLKTFHQRDVYGTSVITLVTVQNTQHVQAVECLSPDLVVSQLEAVLEDIPPAAGFLPPPPTKPRSIAWSWPGHVRRNPSAEPPRD